MRWEKWIGIAASAWLLSGCAAQMDNDRYAYGGGGAGFTGTWQIDASQSDVTSEGWNTNRGWNDQGDRNGVPTDRDDQPGDRDGSGSTGNVYNPGPSRGWRAGMLPDAIRIDVDRGAVRIEDPSGNVVESVALNGYRDRDGNPGYQPGSYRNDQGMMTATGRWSGNRRLQIAPTVIGNRNVSQTLSLDGRDRLVVVTTVSGERGTRTVTTVYDRAS